MPKNAINIVLDSVSFVYPFKTSQLVRPENMGVLTPYYKTPLTKEQADNLICRLLKKNPCVHGAMMVSVLFHEVETTSDGRRIKIIYFAHDFRNYLVNKQTIGELPVTYNF